MTIDFDAPDWTKMSVEKSMKLLNWVSHRVYGQEARHRLSNTTVLSRFAMESFERGEEGGGARAD